MTRLLALAAFAAAALAPFDGAFARSTSANDEIRLAMRNLYQNDERFSDMFGANGSMICGAVSMANALLYLRTDHAPPYADLASDLIFDWDDQAVVEATFRDCGVNKDTGVGATTLLVCANAYMNSVTELQDDVWTIGFWRIQDMSPLRRAPTPKDLRDVLESNGVALMFFGLYSRDAADPSHYRELGGHWVALAGVPQADADPTDNEGVYISDPLENYAADGPASHLVNFSRVPAEARFSNYGTGKPFTFDNSELWQYQMGDDFFVILKAIVVLGAPRPRSNVLTYAALSDTP
jgi:hypothetical protein